MRIDLLRLINFKGFADQTFAFPRSVDALSGGNGSFHVLIGQNGRGKKPLAVPGPDRFGPASPPHSLKDTPGPNRATLITPAHPYAMLSPILPRRACRSSA